jgi:hypothetical protein
MRKEAEVNRCEGVFGATETTTFQTRERPRPRPRPSQAKAVKDRKILLSLK